MTSTDESNLKFKRRGAKSRFTRFGKATEQLIDGGRSRAEAQKSFEKYEQAYHEVEDAHDKFTMTIKDEAEYDREDVWMEDVQNDFSKLQCKFIDYVKVDESASSSPTGEDTTVSVLPGHQGFAQESMSHFKIERPRLPKFSGDIREYCIFKSDFEHVIGSRCSSRDAMMILRSCLQGKPLQLIQGIGQDYAAAWEQLDTIYGDSRYVADTIISDISKFRPLKEGEDARFCDLVHLVRRSFNTLNEIGKQNDMNNSHMLAIIERKMCPDDRRLWFRDQDGSSETTLHSLMNWMAKEMRARMRSSAPLRSEAKSSIVNMVSTAEEKPSMNQSTKEFKCWVCKSYTGHWTDQCRDFISKSAPERWEMVKSSRACYSCLKKAGRDHVMSNCNRRRRCSESRNGVQCTWYHHPLLHTERSIVEEGGLVKQVGVATVIANECLLPVTIVDVISKRTMQQGNLLLDSGAEISLIRKGFAERLKLKGTPITITMVKIGRDEEVLQTLKYRIPIREAGKSTMPIMIDAIGIHCISGDITAVDLGLLSKKFGLKEQELKRGTGAVDLLVGIDHARLHGGEVREVGHLAARRSPVGWVVFGKGPTDRVSSSSVLHIKISSQVDLLPDNKILVTTEKRPERNEKYASAYKEQMREMEDLKFSRKLSEDEKDEKDEKDLQEYSEVKPEWSLSKRKILKQIAQVFDSLSFAAAFLIRAKIGIQSLLGKGYDWDEMLPEADQKWWIAFFKEMKELDEVKFERSLTPSTMIINHPMLCRFADASQNAFGACVYLRWQLENGDYDVRFADVSQNAFGACIYLRWPLDNGNDVMAKSRVAPLKKMTIPRLELQAAVMATRLFTTVMKELRLQVEQVMFMTDSRIVLPWVRRKRKRFKTFVAVRIAEVQSQSDPAQWRYVPGNQYPADDVSRGLPAAKLGHRWQQGSEFLYSTESEWPQDRHGRVAATTGKVRKQCCILQGHRLFRSSQPG
ncbi:uncharacterized protein LOC105444283 [Strongylocentrotus purpuratus]|uniref:Peptidase A2 domain-containing protein n=1 Tax=Strongylocentrotus purpuratus TaxID=7668 RepID=A0A7M7PL01_STRPU|nr:uncharacterized protein LOC100892844 [Strongylocentrotus purpuratus]XP_030853468.1 uncharacterized protein LOC105444283 [Strongylocentrotus purpuratus]